MQPLHVMWRSGVNSTSTVLFWCLLEQGRCAVVLWLSHAFFPFLGDLFPFFASPACLVYVVNLSTTGSVSQDLFTHIDLSRTLGKMLFAHSFVIK